MNPSSLHSLRGTGRTTRMLQVAAALARMGKTVTIVVINELEARRIRQWIIENISGKLLSAKPKDSHIEVIVWASLFAGPREFNIETLRFHPHKDEEAVLIDHLAISEKFPGLDLLQRELHRFDPEPHTLCNEGTLS